MTDGASYGLFKLNSPCEAVLSGVRLNNVEAIHGQLSNSSSSLDELCDLAASLLRERGDDADALDMYVRAVHTKPSVRTFERGVHVVNRRNTTVSGQPYDGATGIREKDAIGVSWVAVPKWRIVDLQLAVSGTIDRRYRSVAL